MYQFYTVEITKTQAGELSHAEPEEEPEEERTECNK